MKKFSGSKDPERSRAMKGNQNAKGGGVSSANKYGARSAAIGMLIPLGNPVSAALLSSSGGSEIAAKRHAKTSAAIGGVAGAVKGSMVGTAIGAAKAGQAGAIAGGVAGGLLGAGAVGSLAYGFSRAGTKLGRKIKR
jgi:hypothetical protein